jgi:hypothetical protein
MPTLLTASKEVTWDLLENTYQWMGYIKQLLTVCIKKNWLNAKDQSLVGKIVLCLGWLSLD